MSPPWTLFTMTLLTLLALLAPGSADARSCGRGQRPTVAATAANGISRRETLFSSYGDEINIFCSSNDASKLTIRDNDYQLQANGFNSTTIQVTLRKPDVGFFEYLCKDSNTNCTDTLLVHVTPAISVTASLLLPDKNARYPSYVVLNSEAYNVYCSAHQISNLTIHRCRKDVFTICKKLHTKPVNETTVMVTVTNDTEGGTYGCKSSWFILWFIPKIYIITEYYPGAQHFQCVVNLNTNKAKIHCSWKSLSERHIFNLSMIHDSKSTLICVDMPGSTTGGCGSVLPLTIYFLNVEFSLLLQTCNTKYTSFCTNQIFKANLQSITKLNPIDDLKLVNTWSQRATVAWTQSVASKYCSYRIEYRLLGTDWRSVNASTVRSVQYRWPDSDTCELQLALPCPDAHYELRVHVRRKEAIGDLYWSDPSSLYFFTAPSTGGEVDPACGADFREPAPTPSARIVALHEVRELISDERKEVRALKKRISDMYRKVAEIKALMNAQK